MIQERAETAPARADVAPPDPAAAAKVVPLRRQYLQIKHRFPDTVLLFRLGDFYETFDDDARLAADILDIVLTGRDMGKGIRVPMAGIPHHAADGHIARLVAAGHKVAVCEQLGEPGGRGLVERDVTRVVTPGTVIDPAMLDARRNNFIAAVVVDSRTAGFAVADVSTGEFATTELTAADADATLRAVGRELHRLGPAECVMPVDNAPRLSPLLERPGEPATPASTTEGWRWRLERTSDTLRRQFGVESLDGFGCAGKPLAIRAAGGLLDYLLETQRAGVRQITHLVTYTPDDFMALDVQTRRNLELTESARGDRRHSLVAILDQTRTPMGARLLRRWLGQPLVTIAPLRERQDAVDRFWRDGAARAEIRRLLGGVGDAERQVNRCVAGLAAPRELASLRASLVSMTALADFAGDLSGAADLRPALTSCEAARALLARALVDEPPAQLGKGEAIRAGFSPELDAHQARVREARDWIAGLERTERERSGIRSLKVGYNRVFGYFLEITTAALAAAERDHALAGANGAGVLPSDYLPKQSLANATRFITPQLKEFEAVILNAQQTSADLEADVYRRVMAEVAGRASRLLAAAGAIAYLDVVATLADVAAVRDYVRPELDDSLRLEIRDGRHPTLEAVLEPGAFIANDAVIDAADARVTLLTGPNMAG
ncbi:MAG TPA: DNA mismatch repair protein MutS, partial [Thermomicrobiales bacterium]|nr:DNA mismatch repair protein MutS [Thermomicrobiales bacterium]